MRELHFGELDASQEAAVSPDLLRDGYFDFRDAAYSIASQGAWLLLGPKGAGKSAVLEYLRLLWIDREDRFFSHWELDTFPVLEVPEIGASVTTGQGAQLAWEMLLYMRLLESLDADQGALRPPTWERTMGTLRKLGHVDARDRGLPTKRSREWTIDLKLLKLAVKESEDALGFRQILSLAKREISEFQTSSQHVLALDGLDTFFFVGGAGWESLSGLVDALAAVNRFLVNCQSSASVVMTLRSDHFDSINSQNSNKLKDRTVFLDWAGGGIGAQNSLWQIATRKAAVGRPEITDIVKQYLSEPVTRPEFHTVAEYLLTYTRLLPRDIVALLRHLQQCHPGSRPVTSDAAKAAAREYSEQYFVGEVMNNLAGVLPPEDAHKIPEFRDALRSAPTRYFDIGYLREELAGILDTAEIRSLLKRMFETGAIGISNPTSSGQRYTDFVFRRVSGASFTPRYEFQLHDALTRAWNRPWK